jgi:indolepyruvate ferredoxin oxidoreductase beta subunit
VLQSIFLTGVGGQGVITLAGLISERASEQGLRVSLFSSKGMAQRGGRVSSEIRLTDDPGLDFGARISTGRADVLIGMEIGESINSYSFLKPGGAAILLDYAHVPAGMILKRQPYPSFEQLKELYSAKAGSLLAVKEPRMPHNMFLLGVFAGAAPALNGELAFYSDGNMEQAIAGKLKRDLEQNLESFKGGCEFGRSLLLQPV